MIIVVTPTLQIAYKSSNITVDFTAMGDYSGNTPTLSISPEADTSWSYSEQLSNSPWFCRLLYSRQDCGHQNIYDEGLITQIPSHQATFFTDGSLLENPGACCTFASNCSQISFQITYKSYYLQKF